MGAARRDQVLRRFDLIQPVQGLGQAGQVFAVAGQAIEAQHRLDVGAGGVGGEGLRFNGAGAGGLQRVGEVLQAPGRLRHGLLGLHIDVHAAMDGVQQACIAATVHGQTVPSVEQKLQVLARHIVIEGDVGGVVLVAMHAAVLDEGIALGPAAVGILGIENELDGLVQRRAILALALLQIDAQQQLRSLGRARVVEGGVAVVAVEFLHPPGVLAIGGVPALQRFFARRVDDVVPAARRVLAAHQGVGRGLGGLVELLVAGGVIGVQIEVADGGRAGRLDPDHGRRGFQLAPAAREIGQDVPDITALDSGLVGHEARRTLHRGDDGGAVGRGLHDGFRQSRGEGRGGGGREGRGGAGGQQRAAVHACHGVFLGCVASQL
ncbi:hypothetical protein D3C71_587160 [compost metagenome]